ncbi:FAD/NAD(P)-binding domain-containing protein [Linnemannia elongata AG-77]|uniref:FAD/NAD(P)-binding domain-containing protein n=1 Tax=Linnemannia elongata AG-77 TaxID=1314771 RepID=A0A197KB03_9FUNG|nr:FAD/NAD(P)-binding domain-containing protein [Linnemannia elongata AG-77]
MEINPAVNFKHDRSIMYAKRPKVLIVGAGLGGLTLGMLLHKANIPFEIYERASVVKPLGSAMYFNSTTAPLFKQCGIYDEFLSIGKYLPAVSMCTEDRNVYFRLGFEGHEELFGAKGYIVSRSQLHDLLLRQIPSERVHMNKKVLTTEQGGNGVLLRFSDGTEAEGDILVGADGAYSVVRQNLYETLKKENKLPATDSLPLPFSTVCIVGQTRPLTPEQFPDLGNEESWDTFTTAQNTVCWDAVLYLDEETSKDNDAFRNSEWGPEAAAAMCEQVKDFPIVSGGDKKLTLGDMIEWSDKDLISKVTLEEKVFKTWYGCRTVLIGDACHKMNPSGGAGASNAMHDAIALANRINGLPFHPAADEIEAAFMEYQNERIGWVNAAFENSKLMRNMVGQSMPSKITRAIIKRLPTWVMRKMESQQYCHRPQVAFLPLVEDMGTFRPGPQPSLAVKSAQEKTANCYVKETKLSTAAV